MNRCSSLRHTISGAIKGMTGLNMRVTLVAPGTIPRSEGGKLRRVHRSQNLVTDDAHERPVGADLSRPSPIYRPVQLMYCPA